MSTPLTVDSVVITRNTTHWQNSQSVCCWRNHIIFSNSFNVLMTRNHTLNSFGNYIFQEYENYYSAGGIPEYKRRNRFETKIFYIIRLVCALRETSYFCDMLLLLVHSSHKRNRFVRCLVHFFSWRGVEMFWNPMTAHMY